MNLVEVMLIVESLMNMFSLEVTAELSSKIELVIEPYASLKEIALLEALLY
jgi:hypothetical protein